MRLDQPHLQSHLSFTARGSGCMRAMAVVRGFSLRRVCTLSMKATSLVNCSLDMPCRAVDQNGHLRQEQKPVTYTAKRLRLRHCIHCPRLDQQSKHDSTTKSCLCLPTYIGVSPGGVVTGSRRELLENVFNHAHLGACQVRDLAQVMVHHERHPPLHQNLDHGNLIGASGLDERFLTQRVSIIASMHKTQFSGFVALLAHTCTPPYIVFTFTSVLMSQTHSTKSVPWKA